MTQNHKSMKMQDKNDALSDTPQALPSLLLVI